MGGFALIPTLVISMILAVLGGAAMYISMTDLQITTADHRFTLANKAAEVGLLTAVDSIAQRGSCDISETYTGTVGGANYTTNVVRQGRICFIRSEGRMGPARVIKTAIIQSYYGIGLYTVRGNVNAELGGSARLSGCDTTTTPTCFVPAFIASGRVVTTVPEQSCSADNGVSSGIYGDPAVLSTVRFTDLIPLFFNANCFNARSDRDCDVGLLQIIEQEYGVNPVTGNQDFRFDEYGIPIVNIPTVNVPASCQVNSSGVTVNLATDYTTCSDIQVNGEDVVIRGQRSGDSVNIHFNGTRIWVIDASNFNLYYNNPNSLRGVYLGGTVSDFRIVSRGYVRTVDTSISRFTTIINGVIIIGPTASSVINSPNTNHQFVVRDHAIVDTSVIISKRIRLNSDNDRRALNYWLDSLVYVYAYACPNCSRSSDTSSLYACYYNLGYCGVYAYRSYLFVGRDLRGNPRPSLIISNNSTLYFRFPRGTIYIWGAFVGQDITYLLWSGLSRSFRQDFKGFLIRNFPPDRTIRIRITGSSFTMDFRKDIINSLNQRFWFFRRVQCVQDPLLPYPQMIQTKMTAY